MLAAFRRPAGKLSPIRSKLSRSSRPPFFDLALQRNKEKKTHSIIIILIKQQRLTLCGELQLLYVFFSLAPCVSA